MGREYIGNRCANCGGRMRLVNVTWVNRFKTPEAALYDNSVSRRKAKLGIKPRVSAQEMMCTCCGQRTPILSKMAAKGSKGRSTKQEAKQVQQVQQVQRVQRVRGEKSKKGKKVSVKRVVAIIKFLIFLSAVAVIAYYAYQYKDVLWGYYETAEGIIAKIQELIAKFKK